MQGSPRKVLNPEFDSGHEGLSGFLRSRLLTSQSSWQSAMSLAVICPAQIKNPCPLVFLQPKQLIVPHKRTPVSTLCKQMLLAPTSLDVQAAGLKINSAGVLNFWLQLFWPRNVRLSSTAFWWILWTSRNCISVALHHGSIQYNFIKQSTASGALWRQGIQHAGSTS